MAAEPIASNVPDQKQLRPDERVRSIEEFIVFLDEFIELFGRDDRPRAPTTGERFLL